MSEGAARCALAALLLGLVVLLLAQVPYLPSKARMLPSLVLVPTALGLLLELRLDLRTRGDQTDDGTAWLLPCLATIGAALAVDLLGLRLAALPLLALGAHRLAGRPAIEALGWGVAGWMFVELVLVRLLALPLPEGSLGIGP